MKKTIILLATITILVACKKETTENILPEPAEVTVTARGFSSNSMLINGAKTYFVNIKTSYPLKSNLFLNASFNNDYFTGNPRVSVRVKMPYLAQDTTVETNQNASIGLINAANFRVDSITGITKFRLIY